MRKNILVILMISLVLAMTLASCSNSGASTTMKTVRIVGTARPADSAQAVSARATSDKLVLASVDKVIVNGTDITSKLVPSDSASTAGNNVEFQAQVEVFDRTTIEASAKKDFVFDEWEVLEEEGKEGAGTVDPAFLERIEDWLDEGDRSHNEKLVDVPAEYLPYLVAEYDNGFYVDLDKAASDVVGDGSRANPFSVDEFIAKAAEYKEDELTLVLRGTNVEKFKALEAELSQMASREQDKLEELKLKGSSIALDALPSITVQEVVLAGFTFSTDISLDAVSAEYEFEGCNFANLTITNVASIELNGGKATSIVVKSAGEVEIENMTIDTLDFGAMTQGEVEIENVKTTKPIVKPTNEGVKFENEDEQPVK